MWCMRPAAAVLAMTVAVSLASAAFVKDPCQPRADAVMAGQNNISDCGSDACPGGVNTQATIVGRADLPIDGWFVYRVGGTVYKSPLKTFSPQAIPNLTDAANTVTISDDGEWLLYKNNTLIKVDGSAKKGWINMTSAGEPKEQRWRRGGTAGSKEIAVLLRNRSTNNILVHLYNLNNGSPTGTTPIGENLGTHYSFFACGAADFIVQGSQKQITTFGYARTLSAAATFPIKSNGTSTSSDRYNPNPLFPGTCGISVNPDGTKFCANFAGGYQDCYPDNHKGFAVIPFGKPPSGEAQTDWIARSGVSVRWCPKTYDGSDLWSGNDQYQEFQFYEWTNKEQYIGCIHKGNTTPIKGAWLVRWDTNEWTLLTDKTTAVDYCAVYITTAVGIGSPQRRAGTCLGAATRQASLQRWHDILGRGSRAREEPAACASVRVRTDGTRAFLQRPRR